MPPTHGARGWREDRSRRAGRFLPLALTLSAVAALVVTESGRAAFPGQNGRIAFSRGGDVWSVAVDGSDEVNLTDHEALDADQRWSADGTKIVFTSDRSGNRDVWVMDADGSNPTQVTTDQADDSQPAWSPDGTQIAFMTERDGDREIYVVNADGSNPVNLTNSPGTDDDDEPQWSPDGTTISFYRGGDVWLMDADGGNQRNATAAAGSDDFDQNWSPDGAQMVFDSNRDGDREIFLMDADGGNQVQLTMNGNRDRQPVFSPDGATILFESDRDGIDQLYVMDVDGQNQQSLNPSESDDQEPDWQPIVSATTTTVASSTTTTTLSTSGGVVVPGKLLLLKDNATKPKKRRLKLIAKDEAIGTGAENGSSGDPTLHGGFLKVVSANGDTFNTTYELPAASWRTKGKPGKNKGYKLKKVGPIKTVLVKLGKSLKVVAKGEALGHTLVADPDPVHVALGLGSEVYCLTFGGETRFKPGKTYRAKKAPTPETCQALVPRCGDGLLEDGEACPLLEGPPDGPALDATFDFEDLDPVPPSAIGLDVEGDEVVRTRIKILFPDDATVGAVNDAIERVAGRIVSMVSGVPTVVIEIPDPGTAAALDALLTDLEAQPGVTWALASLISEPDVLPSNYQPVETADLSRIDHHLAIRAHAAWNVRSALQGSFLGVVVYDFFGDGVPDSAFDVNAPAPGDFSTGTSNSKGTHGYHVLGIIGASFAGAKTPRGWATGMVPDTLQVRVVDSLDSSLGGSAAEEDRILRILRAGPGPRILNTSRGFSKTCGRSATKLNKWAVTWTKAVRMAGLEDRVLHLTSAGNINSSCPTLHDPLRSSEWIVASMGAMTDASGAPVPNLTNILVVENSANTAAEPYEPSCLSKDSYYPGQIGGIGEVVWSLQSADATGIGTAQTAGNKGGTSMSTPQVAGLAAYLWRLDPALTLADLRALLLETARPAMGVDTVFACATGVAGQPVVDAYGAVLALDEATLPTPGSAPIRFALLDVDDDGDFDGIDLFEWTTILIDGTTGELQEPVAPSYDRYDLNGDGYTGGVSRTAAFDLDRVGSTRYGASTYGTVQQAVESVEVDFDETAVNDLEILCYYAYSDLYGGTDAEREQYLGTAHCSPYELTATLPSPMTPGVPETLQIALGERTPTGSQPVADAWIEMVATNGGVSPETGRTDAQGELQAQATLTQGDFLTVEVRALTDPGGDLLAVTEAVAASTSCLTSGGSGAVTFVRADDQAMVTDSQTSDGAPVEAMADDGANSGAAKAAIGCTFATAEVQVPPSGFHSAVATARWEDDVRVVSLDPSRPARRIIGRLEIMGEADSGGSGQLMRSQVRAPFAIIDGGSLVEYSSSGGGFSESEVVDVELPGQFGIGPVQLRIDTNAFSTIGSISQSPVWTEVRTRWLGITEVQDEAGMPIADYTVCSAAGFDWRSAADCGFIDTTTSTSTSTSTSTTTSTTTSTSTSVSSSSVTVTTTSTTTTTTLFAAPVTPYRRYVATGPDGPAVALDDEFGMAVVDLGTVALELPPVTIDGRLPPDPDTHQTCYAHPGGVFDTCIDVQNDFGLAPLRVGNPVAVCVPELFPAIAVDAFQCYAADGEALDVPATLEDEFQTQAVTVGAPELLCVPVAIDGSPLVDTGRYLVCYGTTPAGAAGGQIQVENVLHGAPIQVDVGTATGVCVPALRQVVATCDLCGNGVTDGAVGEECDDGNVASGDGCSAVCRTE